MKQNLITLAWLAAISFCLSCSEDDKTTVGFESTSGYGAEGDNTHTININFGKKLNYATTVTLNIMGNATLDGDFFFTTTSSSYFTSPATTSSISFTAKAGESTLPISFDLIDDILVEPANDILYFQITTISDSDIASALTNDVYAYEITDNDVPPANALQIDLSWNLGDGISINAANFDLYLANNVTENEDDEIVSADLVDQVYSNNEKGYESFTMNPTLPDDDYYIVIRYTAGSSNAALQLILSENNSYSRAAGYVTSDYSGKDIYYGPLTKKGSNYSRTTGNSTIETANASFKTMIEGMNGRMIE